MQHCMRINLIPAWKKGLLDNLYYKIFYSTAKRNGILALHDMASYSTVSIVLLAFYLIPFLCIEILCMCMFLVKYQHSFAECV